MRRFATSDSGDLVGASMINTTSIDEQSDVGPISPVFIKNDSARYYFQQIIDEITFGFPIDFALENGKWVIVDF